MKKILVIGLAAAMMTSTAFASTVTPQAIQPGAQIVFNMKDFKDEKTLYVTGKSTKDNPVDAEGDPSNAAIVINPKTYNIGTTKPAKGVTLTGYNSVLGATWDVTTVYGQNGDDQSGSTKYIGNTFGIDTRLTGSTTVGENKWTEKDLADAKLKVDKIARQDIAAYDFTATNFAVMINVPVGRNFIKNYEFDGAGNLTINIKPDYKLPSNGKPDMVLSDVTVKSKRNITKLGTKDIALYKDRSFTATTATGGATQVDLGEKGLFSIGVEFEEQSLYKNSEIDLGQYATDGTWVKFMAEDAYSGDVKFDGGNIMVKGKVYNNDVVSFMYDPAPNAATIKVIQNNPVEANIMVHNIMAKNFKTGFMVSIPGSSLFGAEADANGNVDVLSIVAANKKKLYTLSSTGVLQAAPFVYNTATDAWEGRLPATGGTIIISDVALKGVTAGSGNTTTNNPSTGFGVDFSAAIVK